MFLEKLCLRIKGELLAFKEDFFGAEEIRQRAEGLLQKLERHMSSVAAKGTQGTTGSSPTAADATEHTRDAALLKDIELEWDELMKLRDERKEKGKSSETPPPNPRTLG